MPWILPLLALLVLSFVFYKAFFQKPLPDKNDHDHTNFSGPPGEGH
jgi:hypothetical protein